MIGEINRYAVVAARLPTLSDLQRVEVTYKEIPMDVGAFGDRDGWSEKSPYKKWQEKEAIPVYTGCFVEDTMTLPLEDWRRLGGKGAYLNLGGGEESDGYIAEIPPREALNVEHHLFEEIIYVLSGKGATSIWQTGQAKQTFEWQAGSLFAIPLNAWHQHFNGSSAEPVRFFSPIQT